MPNQANPIPFWRGRNVRLLVVFNEKQLALDHMDFSCKREGVKVQDPVCGEDSDRLDFVFTHYSINISAAQQKLALLDAFLKHETDLQANTLPKDSAVGILVFPNDGTQAGYQLEGYTLDDWEFGWASRTDRNSMKIPGRARSFKAVASL